MIPVLNAERSRQADAHTIAHEPVAAVDLMERAARAATQWLLGRYSARASFRVLAGCGNNGGDGLAIARLLADEGASVRVCLFRHRPELAPDARVNLDRLAGTSVEMLDVPVGSIPVPPPEDEVVIDALLGIGSDRPLHGWLKDVVINVNGWVNEVVAIDMPSGLLAEDNAANDPRAIVRADHVLTFQVPKLALLLPENGPFVGEWHCLPIGLDRAFMDGLGTKDLLIEASDAGELMPERPRAGHKGTFGHALLVAGSAGKTGAAVLAARACARSGVGLITVRLPMDLQAVMNVALPEAMTIVDPFEKRSSSDGQARFSAVGIGPGIGTGYESVVMLKRIVQEAPAPLVLDADALNILSENRTWLAFLPKRTILTPHPKEFDRLTERSATGFERLAKARAFAVRFGSVLVLKGANTAICSPDGRVYFNPSGNPGMAKGGSGDALTGIITGLLAQGLEPVSAAVLGVYAHGLAGDLAAGRSGMDGMLPGDLIDDLPLAWKRIRASS
ncbi:MAG: NAD(P)H-hydrate dehydratase [Flavobacteriales bacterium]|nr:NAD(P)H-hydrate dehydratase [Flavobacteriales bacterium]